jgi:hypothetical protein
VVEVASLSAAVKACVVLTGASVVALTGFVTGTPVDAASAHADTTKAVATMGVSDLAGTSRAVSYVIQGSGSEVVAVDDESDEEEQQLQVEQDEEEAQQQLQLSLQEMQQSEEEPEQQQEQANLQAQLDEQLAQQTEWQATLSVPQTDP